jgi:hypothetical protein
MASYPTWPTFRGSRTPRPKSVIAVRPEAIAVAFAGKCSAPNPQSRKAETMETKTPAPRALAVLDTPPPAEPVNKALRITERVRRAVGLLVSGECKQITEAAARVGLARESLGRALDKPHVAEFLRQKVLRHLATQAARAGAVKTELLDSDNEMVRDRASTFVLGLADIAPASAPSLSVNLEIRAGYVIDLSDEPRSAATLRVVSPVAPVIDHDAGAEG